jgi:hypothetical protein
VAFRVGSCVFSEAASACTAKKINCLETHTRKKTSFSFLSLPLFSCCHFIKRTFEMLANFPYRLQSIAKPIPYLLCDEMFAANVISEVSVQNVLSSKIRQKVYRQKVW